MVKTLNDTWSMRGIDHETRRKFELAARKRGLPIGRLADEVLRKAADAILQDAPTDMSLSGTVDELSRRVREIEERLTEQSAARPSRRRIGRDRHFQ